MTLHRDCAFMLCLSFNRCVVVELQSDAVGPGLTHVPKWPLSFAAACTKATKLRNGICGDERPGYLVVCEMINEMIHVPKWPL